ncbi:CYTH domain-containing protein [Pedobacter sandarakinus]|uniref:CYTH domain-containing protein n=1 Tax=Pedobacter sandarakinus TaxID=353156 RepID=UPI002246DC5F|nr:CYTH domain-containing protein [Pedobacter sandarakinus]MCX2576217.1 CYTH domain-containing protein [Pedobacter sandarakinus]
MGKEIERKFLVDHAKWSQLDKPLGREFRQGYISINPDKTVRVRIAEGQAWLTIKGITTGATRLEYEYEIPVAEAAELLNHFADDEVQKTRYLIEYATKIWEIDVFDGENEGLIIAEIELETEQDAFELPEWIAEEVTDDERYYNSNLSIKPFKLWH